MTHRSERWEHITPKAMRVDNLRRFRAGQLFEVLLDGEQIEEISAGLK